MKVINEHDVAVRRCPNGRTEQSPAPALLAKSWSRIGISELRCRRAALIALSKRSQSRSSSASLIVDFLYRFRLRRFSSSIARISFFCLLDPIRSFRESTGKTPYQFLLERGVQRAQTLMRDPRASLAKIAISSGFADQHHLARVFRHITGITPTTYRRSL
jgi:methylphosphotriester-DNA--protein-cysteine methyltransferase